MCIYTFYRPIGEAVLLYGAVDGVRVGGVPVGFIRKSPQVHLMKPKTNQFLTVGCFKWESAEVCVCTCFMIPAEVKTPQISVREKSSSFALSLNHARASSSSTPDPDSLVTALSMLVLHSGSLYKEDMDLSERRG